MYTIELKIVKKYVKQRCNFYDIGQNCPNLRSIHAIKTLISSKYYLLVVTDEIKNNSRYIQ